MAGKVRGLYAITPDEADTRTLVDKVRQALDGGAALVQYRNKSASPALQREQGEALLMLCHRYRVPLIVNDNLELALAIDADGVHLGAEDAPAGKAKNRLGPGKILGVSCYNRLELAVEAEKLGADYAAFGSVFPSKVKPEAVVASLDLLAQAKQCLRVPVVAIGGITAENAHHLARVGVDAIAVITAVFGAPDIRLAARAFCQLFEATHLNE